MAAKKKVTKKVTKKVVKNTGVGSGYALQNEFVDFRDWASEEIGKLQRQLREIKANEEGFNIAIEKRVYALENMKPEEAPKEQPDEEAHAIGHEG
jgi:hypothetical protein